MRGDCTADCTPKGFYLADEPSGRTFSSLAAEVAAVRKAAPGALSFINLLPSNVSGRGKGTNAARWAREWGAPNYTAYVRALVDVVDPDVVCFDHYPTFGRNVAGKRENDTREDYVRNLALAGGVTWEAGIPLWQYFNIVPYGGRHEDPTEAQVRENPNATHTHTPSYTHTHTHILIHSHVNPDDVLGAMADCNLAGVRGDGAALF